MFLCGSKKWLLYTDSQFKFFVTNPQIISEFEANSNYSILKNNISIE